MRGEPLGRRASDADPLLAAARLAVDAAERFIMETEHRNFGCREELRQDMIRRNDELRNLLIERGY